MELYKRFSMTKRKVLILGGAGFLGRHISRRFADNATYQVTIGDLVEPTNENISYSFIDIFDNSILDEIIRKNDIVINCTGQITSPISNCLKINTEGILNIINSVIRNKKKLFHISTVAVYGTCAVANEQSELNPESPYAVCKAFAEFQLKKITAINPCILRLPNLYGEDQQKGLFSYLIKSYSTDKQLSFNNNGSLTRYYLHITDCSEYIFQAVEKNISGVFNLPAPDKLSLQEIVKLIETKKSISFNTNFSQATPIENIQSLSFNKYTELVAFNPRHSIQMFINNSFK